MARSRADYDEDYRRACVAAAEICGDDNVMFHRLMEVRRTRNPEPLDTALRHLFDLIA